MNHSYLTQAAEMLAQARRERHILIGEWRITAGGHVFRVAVDATPSKQCLSCGAYTRPDGSLPCDH